ncbi:hypothetical protein MKX07_003315 [Trichoderma sp. CBMAI-0711]|nr:hypothetical protein MKX07_003315 [Trichoderma sp. CBMAI-0711]
MAPLGVAQGGRDLSAKREERDVEAPKRLDMEVRGGLALVAVTDELVGGDGDGGWAKLLRRTREA